MHFANRAQAFRVETILQRYERRPKTPMNIGHLAFDQPANKNVLRGAKRAGTAKNLPRLRMAPPTSANPLARDQFCECGEWTAGRFQHDPFRSHKSKSFRWRHCTAWGRSVAATTLFHVENLDEGDASATVLARDNSSELSWRRQGREDARFLGIGKTKSVRREFCR